MAIGAAALLAAAMGTAAMAADAGGSSQAPENAAPQQSGDQSYEIHDAPDSPPVNYRSNEDKRYATPQQHDAEMYAEQYEQKRREEALRQKKLLDNMNRIQPRGGRLDGTSGGRDETYPSRSPF